jgi:hypothetical protein
VTSPNPNQRIPDPGVRPTPTPTPSPSPASKTAGKDEPGLIDKAIGALASNVPGVDELGNAEDGLRAVRAWVSDRHNWVRVAWFLGGSLMFSVGVVMLAERPLAKAATTVTAPVGKVVKSVYK